MKERWRQIEKRKKKRDVFFFQIKIFSVYLDLTSYYRHTVVRKYVKGT